MFIYVKVSVSGLSLIVRHSRCRQCCIHTVYALYYYYIYYE